MSGRPIVHVVDDDVGVRESLALLLETAGIDTLSHASGGDFLARLDEADGGCVLLDVRMPDIGGLEIQQTLAARGTALPVIIITGHGDIPMAVAAMKAGAFDFIEKPFSRDKLLRSVQNALAEGERQGQAAARAEAFLERCRSLTPRERDVLCHLVIGRPNKVIAYELGISPRTVEIHRARVMDKTKVGSLSELVRLAVSSGLDGLPSGPGEPGH